MPRIAFVANWKMHKTADDTWAFLGAFQEHTRERARDAIVAIAPPFTSLATARAAIAPSAGVALAAQNVHWDASGAFTGEISVPMLAEFDVRYVIVGHSERRASFGETDSTVNRKVKAVIEGGMTPIVAVGESIEEREAGQTQARVLEQTQKALDGLTEHDVARVMMAYEPIWAIGTGKHCDADEADRVMGAMRSVHPALHDVSMLYGGSMKPDNVESYMQKHNINGGLVGGASLDPHMFAELVDRGLDA